MVSMLRIMGLPTLCCDIHVCLRLLISVCKEFSFNAVVHSHSIFHHDTYLRHLNYDTFALKIGLGSLLTM